MFVALAIFQITPKSDPTNPSVEGHRFKMRLAELRDFHETAEAIPGLMSYDDTVAKMLESLPDLAMFAGQEESLERLRFHVRLESRGEFETLSASIA